jgi:hypothetical protein
MALSLERIIWYNSNCFLHVEIFVEEPFFAAKKLLDERWEVVGSTILFTSTFSLLLKAGSVTKKLVRFEVRFIVHQIVHQIVQKNPLENQIFRGVFLHDSITGSRKCELPQCMMDVRICSMR